MTTGHRRGHTPAMDLEEADTSGKPVNLAVLDLSKAFDHISHQLLYEVLRIGGFPKGILAAYRDFQEALEVHHTIGSHIGEGHARNRIIPQGDPWSMFAMAFLMIPWILEMVELGVVPRVLADDLLLGTEEGRNTPLMDVALANTEEHLKGMLATQNVAKSTFLSNKPGNRAELRARRWGQAQVRVRTVHDVRDLGSHLNTIRATRNGTMQMRCERALSVLERILHMPALGRQRRRQCTGSYTPWRSTRRK